MGATVVAIIISTTALVETVIPTTTATAGRHKVVRAAAAAEARLHIALAHRIHLGAIGITTAAATVRGLRRWCVWASITGEGRHRQSVSNRQVLRGKKAPKTTYRPKASRIGGPGPGPSSRSRMKRSRGPSSSS